MRSQGATEFEGENLFWAYQIRKANTRSEEAISSASQKKKKKRKQKKKTHTPKPSYLSIGNKSWKRERKKKKRGVEPQKQAPAWCDPQNDRLWMLGSQMGGTDTENWKSWWSLSPETREDGAPHFILAWATKYSKRCVSSLSWSNAQLFCWDHEKSEITKAISDVDSVAGTL